MTAKRISVLVAGSEVDLGQDLKDILGNEAWIEVVGSSDSRTRILELTKELTPQVVVMDLGFDGDGLQASKQILNISPETKIIVLSVYDYVGRVDVRPASQDTLPALDSIEWLSKNSKPAELLESISKPKKQRPKRRLQ